MESQKIIHPRQLGKEYESIMRRIFSNTKSNRNGCDSYLMVRLVDSEMVLKDSQNFQKHNGAPSISKQTERLRKHIYEGIGQLKKRTLEEDELSQLLDIEDDVEYAQSFRSIMHLLNRLDDFLLSISR